MVDPGPDDFDADLLDDGEDGGHCPHCGRLIYTDTEQCPHCRTWLTLGDKTAMTDRRARIHRRWLVVIILALVAALVLLNL